MNRAFLAGFVKEALQRTREDRQNDEERRRSIDKVVRRIVIDLVDEVPDILRKALARGIR